MSSPPEFQILKLALSTVNEPEIVSLASGSDYEAEALLNFSTQVKIMNKVYVAGFYPFIYA